MYFSKLNSLLLLFVSVIAILYALPNALTNFNYIYAIDIWTYSLWARYIFDEYYSTRGFYFGNEAPNFEDTLYERHGDPRHVGLSVRYDF